jgi:hypothetical protein
MERREETAANGFCHHLPAETNVGKMGEEDTAGSQHARGGIEVRTQTKDTSMLIHSIIL